MEKTHSDPAATQGWKWYRSLRGKLTLAFLSIVALFSLAMMASDASFQGLRENLDSVHETTLPRVLALQEVGVRVPGLLRTASTVQGVETLEGLEQAQANLDDAKAQLMKAIEGLGSEDLAWLVQQIDDDLSRILEAKRAAIRAGESSRESTTAFASAAADLTDQLERDRIRVQATGGDASSIRDLRAQILSTVTELRVVPELGSKGLERVERSYEIERRACVAMLVLLEPELRAARARALGSLFVSGGDPASLFARQQEFLTASARVDEAVAAGARSADVLQARAAKFADESARETARSRQAALREARRARRIQVALFIAALLLSGLILWLYVGGRIARRMEQLSDDLTRLSTGELDVEVRGGGDTEVARLASAAEVFRKNARELEQTMGTLEMRNATLNEFAYVASHDLKSPMRGIANLADWIRDDCGDDLPPLSREHLSLISERIEKMESLLEELLRYSRLGNDKKIAETLHLGTLIQDVLELLDLPPKVRVTLEGEDRTILSIAAPLQLCLRNLIQNAVRHGNQVDPHIQIRITDAETDGRSPMLSIVVEDNGPGIPVEHRREAFRIFRKLHHGEEGTGMGLALTKRAAELMGGQVTIEDAEPHGARLRILWPATVLQASD